MLLQEDFGRAAQIITTREHLFLRLPLGDLVDELLGQLKLVLAGLDVRAAEPLYVSLIEDGLHRLDLAQRFFELAQQIFFEHAGVQRRFVSRIRKDVPGAEDQIFELCQRHEVFD